jgi:hypothetical protein
MDHPEVAHIFQKYVNEAAFRYRKGPREAFFGLLERV